MRLSFSDARSMLLHESPDVRWFAGDYFATEFCSDPSVMHTVMRAVDRFGIEDAFEDYRFLRNLAQDADSVGWMLRDAYNDNDSEHLDIRIWIQLSDVFSWVDLALLQPFTLDELQKHGIFFQHRKRIRRRKKLATWSVDRLIAEFDSICEQQEQHRAYPRPQARERLNLLVEALGRLPEASDWVLAKLQLPITEWTWRTSFLLDLAARLRLEAAIPILVELLGEGFLDIYEEAEDALQRFQNPQAVTLIGEKYRSLGRDFRISAAYVLQMVHGDETVRVCRELLAMPADLVQDDDMSEHTERILMAWLNNCEPDAIEPTRQFLLTMDEKNISVLTDLIAMARACDVTFPEFDEWATEVRIHNEQVLGWDLGLGYSDRILGGLRDIEDDDDPSASEEEVDEADGIVALPIVRELPRVGRNDPCPCGSGKKFKQCCIHKHAEG
jgi:hypothetical protein